MRAVLLALALLAVPGPHPPAVEPGATVPVTYAAPVDAPVTDPFRPPATPYGPGNRGLEYATDPGTPVRAAAAGTVTFAGSVADARHVTLQHADGARTTYAGLATIEVREGEVIEAGRPVGTAARALLWTVRLGGAYLDPAVLLAASGQVSAHLVPVREEWRLEGARPGP